MLCRRRRLDWLGITAIAAAMVGFPATALAADPGNPEVIAIQPSTGMQTVLASGAPLTHLGSIAVGPSGTIYVANIGPQATLKGSGIYALTAPGFAISPFATTTPSQYPRGVVVAGSTLYSTDSGVRSIDTSAPFTQRIVSPTCDTETTDCIPDPDYAALSGSTLYGTTYVDCFANGDAGNLALGNWVSAIDIATGTRKQIAFRDCHAPALQGIAAAADGTLLVAASGETSEIDRVNPLDGTHMTVLSKGGALHDPRGIALTPSGDLVVADASGAVLGISTQTGKQTTIASGPDFTGATGVAVDATGKIYVTTDGAPPVLKVSAAPHQRVSSAGIRIRASCRPSCTVSYHYTVNVGSGHGDGVQTGVGATRTLRVKLGASLNRQIRSALRRGRKVRVTLTLAPENTRTDAPGPGKTVTVRLTS
jgi:hypothetical protein